MIVKRNGGKVILKGGKVSCSCCEEVECCMYQADKFGVDYQEEDLPDAVEIQVDVGSVLVAVLTRSGSLFFGTGEGQDFELRIGEGDFPGTRWLLYEVGTDENDDPIETLLGDDSCLIGSYEALIIQDQFPDELAVTIPDEFGNENSVFRRDICIWNDDQGVCELVELFFDSSVSKFKIRTINCDDPTVPATAEKIGDQNTPIGNYTNGFSVAEP